MRPQKIFDYVYDDFSLHLPRDWRKLVMAEGNSLEWHSVAEDAFVTVSIDAHEVPVDGLNELAEARLDARHQAMDVKAPGQVAVLNRICKPRSDSDGLELNYAAQLPQHTYFYLGYVNTRKVFNFGLTCEAGPMMATKLYDQFMQERLCVKLP